MRISLRFILCISILAVSINIFAQTNKAPDFELKDIHSEKSIHLSDYRGKVVYLDFWASWCSVCLKSLPLFSQWQQRYGQDFVVISVNVDEVKQHGIDMANRLNLNYLVLYDENMSIAKSYNASLLPSSFIIDTNGDVHYKHLGFKLGDGDKLEKIIQQLLIKTNS